MLFLCAESVSHKEEVLFTEIAKWLLGYFVMFWFSGVHLVFLFLSQCDDPVGFMII